MSLRTEGGFRPKLRKVNCILMNGGVGDHMGSLVAVDYIIRSYPWITLLVWVPDFLLAFAKNVLPNGTFVSNYSAMKLIYNQELTTITTEWDGKTSPMKMHSVDYAFLKLCDEAVSVDKKNYLRVNFDGIQVHALPEKYVVLTTGFTAPVREFLPEAVNGVADHVLQKGYTPVFLGQKDTKTGAAHVIQGTFNDQIDFGKGISLIDQTSLLEAAKVMQGAAAVVGVDCGLLHVAGCTSVPIIAGFTTVNPELRAPIRGSILGKDFYPVVPDEALGCRFCQVSTNFLYGHDYKYCMYKDYQCVKQLTAAKFIEQLDKVLTSLSSL